MSITDELRKWGYGFCGSSYEVVNAIADRIDAEYRKSEDEWRVRNGQSWLHGYAECHTELLEGNETLASDLERCGWVRLPKDADGEVIHIGDEMEYGEARGRVIALMLSNYPKKWGGGLHWGIQLEGEQAPTALDGFFRHHHAPTVEDVLREFALACEGAGNAGPEVARIAAEYAKRLTLAEGEDA